jgi:hypothetical protein
MFEMETRELAYRVRCVREGKRNQVWLISF